MHAVLKRIAGAAAAAARKGPPPVHLWNPPFCGDLDMRIAADGTWFYLKTPIGRPALVQAVRLGAQARRRQVFPRHAGREMRDQVEDAPFLAVELQGRARRATGQVLHFRTNVDDWVACGAGHALRFEPEPETGGLKPYLHVRRDLWAQGDAGAVLRSGRTRRGARGRRRAHVRRRLGGRVLRHGAGRQLEGIHVMDLALPAGHARRPQDFFARARARLTLDVPAALDDPAVDAARGDHDLDPALWERGRRCGRSGRPPCWCRSSSAPSRRCC